MEPEFEHHDERDVEQDGHSSGPEHPAERAEAPGAGIDGIVAGTRDRYGARWEQIQGSFVDEPRRAVEEADRLVTEVVEQVARATAGERERLARSWSDGSDDTESMRLSLRRYRQIFEFVLR